MCLCCGLCDLIKLSSSLSVWTLIKPSIWNYSLMFKNVTIIHAALDGALPVFNYTHLTWDTSGHNTTKSLVDHNDFSHVLWIVLLIMVTVFGFISLITNCTECIAIYTFAVAIYLIRAVVSIIKVHNIAFVLDVLIFGLILIQCVCILIWESCTSCCTSMTTTNKDNRIKSNSTIVQMNETDQYINSVNNKGPNLSDQAMPPPELSYQYRFN
ncbi:hypothetical protein BLOT_001012 [Blomia tropicalis]|nr:hypothetical protein BLOT_001012 [Blomia tropicalis]